MLETTPSTPKLAQEHFLQKLALETDPWDVYNDLQNGFSGIVVVDARTTDAFAEGHIQGSINLPYKTIDAISTASIPKDKVIVTYCAGVFCNASTKAAARLSALGFRVKEMLDGIDGWKKEGYPLEKSVVEMVAPTS